MPQSPCGRLLSSADVFNIKLHPLAKLGSMRHCSLGNENTIHTLFLWPVSSREEPEREGAIPVPGGM